MSINTFLPSEVIGRILHSALQFHLNELTINKHALSLIQVCRLWRRLELPDIYSFLMFFISPKWIEQNREHQNVFMDSRCSTLSYIAGNNLCKFIKHIRIGIDLDTNSLAQATAALQYIVTSDNLDKTRIKTLAFYIDEDEMDANDPEHVQSVLQLACSICKNFPNVKFLNCHSTGDGLAKRFMHCLAYEYMETLKGISITSEMYQLHPCFSKNLTYLSANMDYIPSAGIPNVFPQTLKVLELFNVPLDYTWNSFQHAQSSKTIEFPHLWKLLVSYKYYFNSRSAVAIMLPDVESWNFKLSFPKLYDLNITNATPCCRIISSSGMLPNTLKRLKLSCDSLAFANFASKKLRHVAQLDLRIKLVHDVSDTKTDSQVYSSMESLLSWNSVSIAWGTLLISLDMIESHIYDMRWKNIHKLHLTNIVNSNSIERLIENKCFPSLEDFEIMFNYEEPLVFSCPELDLIKENDLGFEGSSYIIQPYEANITRLHIHVSTEDNHNPRYILWLQYMVLKLRSLENLSLNINVIQALYPRLDILASQYPHLKNIRIQ